MSYGKRSVRTAARTGVAWGFIRCHFTCPVLKLPGGIRQNSFKRLPGTKLEQIILFVIQAIFFHYDIPPAQSETVSGHKIDYVKGNVAIDMEWNSKDQTFDRDLYAFRTFYECGVITCGVIIFSRMSSSRISNRSNVCTSSANSPG